ncbi:nucleic acid-binding, OB-fold protein [Vibrio phage 1.204.O._10N.222.46.F12]|uniref:DNA ligase n=1 Tax=Vibrio phage 1.204.O._10N.222.46.F12 TaxID=1881263 RepID=A0A2I7RNM4_9CAUD|nr:nucleic acid-binding, OB-fold protein [Vibrio phage 1.204.O._10N.222.46.F12]AUR95245.1 nucleic acid-binding, OB-fold protein [Vibrio phage 1.204.O._10N.222.46.F12]
MNVFEFLGLPADHRKPNKAVMTVKNYEEVPDSKKEFPMFAQLKKDGVYCLVVVHDGKRAMFNRTGKQMQNTGVIKVSNCPDGVYIAELCNDSCSLEVLSGIVNPNRTKALSEEQLYLTNSMYLAYFDFLLISEFIEGLEPAPYNVRHKALVSNKGVLEDDETILKYAIVENEQQLKGLAYFLCGQDEEGVVAKQMGCGWVAGHKGYRQMKIVKNVENGFGIDVDLLCIGFEEGQGKYEGKIANLLFKYKNGATVTAMLGKGWTHAMAERLFIDIHTGEFTPVGKVYRVVGLQGSSKNELIRLPKVREYRHDKIEGDY